MFSQNDKSLAFRYFQKDVCQPQSIETGLFKFCTLVCIRDSKELFASANVREKNHPPNIFSRLE